MGHERSRMALVDGDVTIDWNLARTRSDLGDGTSWDPISATRAYPQPGGAALLASLLTEVARTIDSSGVAWGVHFAPGPITPNPANAAYHHSYALWSNHARGKEPPVWRVEEFLGVDPMRGEVPQAENAPEDRDADLVVLDDAALGYRQRRGAWAGVLRNGRPWIVLKMSSPVAEGELAEYLLREHANRLIVVMTIDDLRRTEVRISRELSWERTAQDLAWELAHNPLVNGLARCAHTVVSFGTAGVFVLSGSEGRDTFAGTSATPESLLFFDPRLMEGSSRQTHPGGVIGSTTCLTAGIVRELMLRSEAPDIAAAVQAGINGMRALLVRGYGAQGAATATNADLKFPVTEIATALASDAQPAALVRVRAPGHRLATAARVQPTSDSGFWTILDERYAGRLSDIAARIVCEGPENVLSDVPLGIFGKLLTVDRREIEALRAIRVVMLEYCRREGSKPLSIAVFGAPGSGKSFGITQVASSLLPGQVHPLQFNLSQFSGPADLHAAFHQVRDVGLAGKLPLVFWDEFDTSLGTQRLGWLRHFLAPMQDGVFQQGEVTHPIGRAIFVFAGGTQSSMEGFAGLARGSTREEFQSAKGPDFVSRLKGFLNVLGPDPHRARAEDASDDATYLIRRAILLRSILLRDAPQLFKALGGADRVAIDRGVLRAFLQTRRYKHGVRSLESVVAMSALTGKSFYERSSLPPAEQLETHVDALDFLALVQQPELSGPVLERLARAAHGIWSAGKRRDGFTWSERRDDAAKQTPLLVDYDTLPETFKEANRVTVRSIPRKLAAAGCVMIPSRSDDPPFFFTDNEIEKLAQLEHEIWMEGRRADGWQLGEPDPENPRQSPYLVPWNELDDAVRQADRDLVQGIPAILAEAGYTIQRIGPASVSETA